MGGICIFADTRGQTLELLNVGRRLAADRKLNLSAFLLNDPDGAGDCISRGADEVLLLPALADDQSLEAFLPVLVEEAKKSDPDMFLFAATARGKELAARVAVHLETGLCSSCTALTYDPERKAVVMERLAHGGAAVQKVVCRTRPVMATIPPGAFEPAEAVEGRSGRTRELPAPPPSRLKVLERKIKAREAQDIGEARVVVSVGRGFEKKEDLAMARELAAALGGEIGCTRPLSEEMHWLPEEACIGLSGAQVKPDLYMGVGVSGQIQHVTGIRNARVICAVNKDENAPIFSVADFGIVGDLYDVVPKLIQKLKQM